MHIRPQLALASIAAFITLGATTHAQTANPSVDVLAVDAPSFIDGSEGDLLPDEIVVDVEDDASDSDIASIASAAGIALSANSDWSKSNDKIELAHVDPADRERILALLRTDPRVESAEPEALYRASFVPDDPLYESKQWHLKRVGAESGWEYTCGSGVTVAVVDTGIACFDKGPFSRGTDLQGTRCEGGYNFVDKSNEAYDDQGHGTHVAGTIAQTTNNGKGTAGLAYCATLMPVKVLNKSGWGTTANVAEGIRFAADNGAQVINLSLGGNIRSKILEDAVKHARAKGVVVVAAAGNSGKSVGYPAAYPDVIAVSATDSNDNLAWFSSRGPEVAIGAPGVAVTQQTICENGRNKCEIFGTFNGTSMASPHVAGAAAMVVSMGVTDPDAVKAALQNTATDKGDKNKFGAGILNADDAVSHAFWKHLMYRAVALLGLFFLIARIAKKQKLKMGAGAWAAALIGGTGLMPFLPLVRLPSHAGAFRWIADLAMRPFGEWDMLLGAGFHKYLALANFGPALVGLLLFYGNKRLRPLAGGFALGSAALLTQMAWSADVSFVFGSIALRLWTALGAAVCVWIARTALTEK